MIPIDAIRFLVASLNIQIYSQIIWDLQIRLKMKLMQIPERMHDKESILVYTQLYVILCIQLYVIL